MHNDQLVYKEVIWAFFGISLWNEKVALSHETEDWVWHSWTPKVWSITPYTT